MTPFGGGAPDYFLLRLNGRLVVRAWPKAGLRTTHAEWVSAGSTGFIERDLVQRMLGTLQNGTDLPYDRRDSEYSEFRRAFPDSHS